MPRDILFSVLIAVSAAIAGAYLMPEHAHGCIAFGNAMAGGCW